MSHVAAVWLLLTGFCWLVSVGQNGNGPVSAAATLERNNNNNNKKKSEKQQQEGEQQLQHPIWKPHISQGALYCHLDQQKAAKMLPFRRGAAWQMLFLLCALAYCINEASSEGRVVCYYTNWSVYRPGTAKFNPQNINPYLCTHLVYAFGGFTKDNQMKPFDKYQDIEQGGYAKFTGLKTYNKQLKTMIAIGGWNEASSRFSPLVASPDRRQQFIKNILKFLRQNHFDGIDLDWEYPAHREGGKSRDRDNYAQFVQELRAEFEREAEKTGRTRLLLTMAVPAGIEYIDKGYDVPKLNKYLDWFNVLTYDFHSSHEPSVNHHAPLYSLEEDSEYNYDAELNIDYSIKYYLKAGADRDKLVLGIPTYGRSYTLINEESTELGAPSEGPGEQGDATREKGYLAYYEICQTLKDDPEWTVVQPNANVMGPYAFRRNQWVGYDDEAIVRKKAEYVVAQGLGGIMFWAIDNDDFRGTCNGKPYPLIEAAKEAMVEALGLGINEVAKPSGPQKPSRSRSRDNGSTRNRLNGKPENTSTSVRPANGARRPAVSRTTQSPPPSTTFKLTDAEGSSLYIGGRASTTPPPPTTPDPGSDFKCEEEGFFQHPRDCKKYYWCLDSGPSGLGIVAHMFTCPSGLYFNPAADSCDFARNVPCKTKKSTTVAPLTSTTTTTTTTARSNRVTAAPTARPVYPRTSSTSTSTTTTTTTPEPVEDLEYEEDTDEQSPNKSHDGEEDPQVIKELIDLIRKVGGVEQLEKHLLRNKDGSITLKENSANGAVTTPSTISKSLYDRVLSRPGTLSSLTRNRLKIAEASGTEATTSTSVSAGNTYSKYSSVLRGNSRQGPQNEGIDKLAEFDGFLKERKQYVTINRQRSPNQGDAEEHSQHEEEDEENEQVETTTRRALSSVTPSYTSLRRTRPTTMAPLVGESSKQEEEEEEVVEKNSRSQQQVKSYATLNRARERTTTGPGTTTTEATEAVPSSTTTRYKYFERTRPTKAATLEASKDSEEPADQEDEEEEYEEENITVQRKQSTNTRKYASIGRRSTTTTATPETTTTSGTETAKANNNNIHYNSNNNKNSQAKQNNIIPTTVTEESSTTALPTPTSTNQEPETTTETNTNETTEPNDRSSTTTTTNNPSTTFTSTPTPSLATTTPTTTIPGVDSESSADGSPNPLIPESPDLAPPTTTTEPELATTTTTTPKTTTPVTTTSTGIHSELNNDIDNDNDSDDSEVTKPKTQYKYATTNRRRITNTTATRTTNTTANNNNSEAANDASPRNGLSSFNKIRASINTNPGRRPPQTQPEHTTIEPNSSASLSSVSSPRPFGYPRRRTRPSSSIPTTTTNQSDNNNSTDNDNTNETDAVASVVKKTRPSPGDRPKNRYQLSRTRGIGSTTTSTTTQAPSSTNARRLAFGARQRAQVTKLTLVDQQTDETEAKGRPGQTEDAREDQDEEASEDEATETTTTTTSRPTPKRIRVLKFRRPLNNTNSIALDSLPNSVTDTNSPQTFDTATVTSPPTDTSTSTVSATGTKRFRKVVRKLRPVDSSTASSAAESNAEETTRKPFIPSNRLKTLSQREQEQEVSDLQRLRDKVKAEQARGEGEQGVINDRLKKLLAEKLEKPRQELPGEQAEETPTSPRPFFKRKLVARRPYTPPSGGGAVATTKAPINFSTTRPTSKFVRRKNGRFDPFNSNVRQRGEGFVRSDPRGARLPGTERFKSQSGDQDDENEDQEEELKAQYEQPLQNQLGGGILRRPFVPKDKLSVKLQAHENSNENSEEEEDDDEEDDSEEDDEEEDETPEKPFDGEEEKPKQDTKPKFNSPYKPKDNRAPPGSRPTFGVTGIGATGPSASGGGNVPFNPRNRPSSSTTNASGPTNRFGTTKRPRVVNRPPGVASPNLTIKPVASDYERTTPLTPLKPAPFIPSNTRSYERKYTGPSTEAAETASENSLIEDLNIDALNARNKKIFDIHSKKHTTLKQKVPRPENGAATGFGLELESEVESGTEVTTPVEEETTEEQGFVTTTPSTPEPQPPAPPSTTQSDTQANPATTITPETETETETVPETEPVTETKIETVTEIDTETETAINANEATSVNSQDLPSSTLFGSPSSTTQAPPPATTLLHVFTLLEGESEDEAQTTTRKPMPLLLPTRQIEVVPKHKFIEINRIVEINSKQAKASQRKSKANQDFGILRVESLPHVEQLGEISVVKYVHLVDGSDIQINDGHSTVADYTPTEPTIFEARNSPPVRNSLPELPEQERNGKSLLPEVISGALETSTISLEGLFDSARKGKQLSGNSLWSEDGVEGITTISPEITDDRNTSTTNTLATMAPAYVRPIVPLLRPESNESSPLVISIANLDQVILSKVQKSLNEAEDTTTPAIEISGTATTVSPDSNSAFSVRQHQVVRAPFDIDDRESTTQTTIDTLDKEEAVEQTTNLVIETTSDSILDTPTPKAVPIGAAIVGQLGGAAYTTSEAKTVISSDAISQGKDFGATNATTTSLKNEMENINPNTVTENNNNQTYQTVNGKRVSESVSFSTEEHVVHRKKSGRKGRGRRLRNRKTSTTTAAPTTTTVETPTTTVDEVFNDTTTMVPE
ncbi:uncharacterized protein LOC6501911 isoform X1 [Drosophila ananassae]|uniref:uncharacterized protein LOC6501911 isoform X1 n=1 Tax=Drosophila ananassae TaxID=7217 RepID=UPI001CFFBC62|nr:uncharacterized protein LOC6501911 isoform X1 [Drosophila ananassae]